jgi:prepilin-type N-terminal cleavage/methylation domain-containing protein
MPMSLRIRRAKPPRAGVTLIEILVVLAIMGMAAAVIMPATSRTLDQATSHAVFFEFQRQVSELRRQANRTGDDLRLIDPQMTGPRAVGDRTVILREPWRYTVAPAMEIAEGGVCAPASVNLVKGDDVIMSLRSRDADCQFIRLQTTAVPSRPPASR